MPEILSRSKQETEEFKNRLDQGFGPDTTKDWFSNDETYSDDLLADQISTQTGALELAYAAPAYGEHPAGYSMYEEMLNNEPLLEAGETEVLLPAEASEPTPDELKDVEDIVNYSDYDDFSKPEAPIENEDEIIEKAFPAVETVTPRAPRHAKEYHVEEVVDAPETKEVPNEKEAELDLVSAALSALELHKSALAGEVSSDAADKGLEAFQEKIKDYWVANVDQALIEKVGRLFREMYDIQTEAASKSVEVTPEVAQMAPEIAQTVPKVDVLAPMATDSRTISRSIELPVSATVKNASQAESTDNMDVQDELDISDEIENVAIDSETAPISTPVIEQIPVKSRMDAIKDGLSSLKEKTSEAFKPRIGGESIQRFTQGEFSVRKPLNVMVDGTLEADWSVANKLYNPLDRSYSYDVISRDGRSMNGVSEAQLVEWRDMDGTATVEVPSDGEQTRAPETGMVPEQTEGSIQPVSEATVVEGPRHRADTSNSILKYTVESTKENVNELLKNSEWWKANRSKVKDAFSPSYWAAKWSTMVVKEKEGWQGEDMTDQEKREFRRKRETLGVVAAAAGFITLGVMINQGHDVSAVHAGIGWDGMPPKAPSPDAMPDISTLAPPHHGSEHMATILGNEQIGEGSTSHIKTSAFDAKDFSVPGGGSGEGLMQQLGLDKKDWFTVQDDLLKRFPDEFYRMNDGNVGIVDKGELPKDVQSFFNAHFGGKG